MEDRLDSIFSMQKGLSEMMNLDRYPKDREGKVSALSTAIMHEAVELQRTTNWKWWKTPTKFDEAEARRLPSGQIDMSIDGEFRPLSFSIPRFESKIEEIEDNMDKTGSKRSINEDALFPEDELEDIIDELEDADLNGEFPFDEREVYRDGLTSIQLPTSIKADRTTAKLPVPPLPPQPAPVNIKTVQAPVNQATGLTSTETALLSPGEQAIRLKQKGLA